ncbi:MAG: 3-dehydroquinate dehydratase [Coxiella sp. (in: Bacteria)]|nr:MAG: 3-dehydroquinate dehydratase [Coxiella sp. (in: g-proteobacteria)]
MRDTLYTLSRQYLEAKNQTYRRKLLSSQQLEHRLSVLVGQRGVGKTTLIVQELLAYVQQDLMSTKILYVPVDHFLISGFTLYDMAESFLNYGGEFIVFDEIHKYPNWSQELKSIYDTFPSLRMIASGSSVLEISKGSHDLVRRSIVSQVVGLSLKEYIEMTLPITLDSYTLNDLLMHHESIATAIVRELGNHNKKILALFNDYLKMGYYPYFLELSSIELYYITLEQNLHATLESDLPAIYPHLTGNSTLKIKQLLSYIAANVPFMTDVKKLKEFIQISDTRTLKNYLYYLEQAHVIRALTSSSKKLTKYEGPAKLYLDNPNQLYALSPLIQNKGTLRELFFNAMLSTKHDITLPLRGDFLVDDTLLFEVGGKKKGFKQVGSANNAYVAADGIECGFKNKIPLWLFGFLY